MSYFLLPTENGIYYPNFLDETVLKHPDINNAVIQGINKLTGREFSINVSLGIICLLCVSDCEIKPLKLKAKKGTLIILLSSTKMKKSKSYLLFYEKYDLPYVYLTISERLKYARNIFKSLEDVRKKDVYCQEVDEMLGNKLGKGSYGEVYAGEKDERKVAVKFAKLKKESIDIPYSRDDSGWHEYHILKFLIKPIIKKKICPNLPLLIDTFTCKERELILHNNEKVKTKCSIMLTELASSTLTEYLKTQRSDDELLSCLFQIMAGLTAIQLHAQILHYDMKFENILVYNCKAGGFWKYKLFDKDYYVPNYGHLFVLNDFGISRSMNIKYPMYKEKSDKTFRLGCRFACIINGKFSPISAKSQYTSSGEIEKPALIKWTGKKGTRSVMFRMNRNGKILDSEVQLTKEQKSFLKKEKVKETDLFRRPDIIPCFEFYNDTQDVLKMFVGDKKKSTQKGNFKKNAGISETIRSKLLPYIGVQPNLDGQEFDLNPNQVCAWYFIRDFFGEYTFASGKAYTKEKSPIIETYNLGN